MTESSGECEKYLEEVAAGLYDPETAADRLLHMRTCRRCREAWTAYEQMLSALRQGSIPQLSPGFNRRLRQRLQRRTGSRRLSRPAQWLMRAYWCGASLAGFYIAFHLPWPAEIHAQTWAVFIFIALAMIVPTLGILRAFRGFSDFALRVLG